MKFKILLIGLILIALLSNISSAFGPHMHNYILDRVKVDGNETDIVQLCLSGGANEQAARAGAMIPDTTVVFYYAKGGANYKVAHNWLAQQNLMQEAQTDNEKCFAWGYSMHLIADSISHTKAIPQKIEKTKVPNWLLHPLWEKKVDSELASEHPELMEETKHMLDGMYGAHGDRYFEMLQKAWGDNIDFNIKEQVDNLAFALDAFYDDAFRPEVKDNSLFAVYPYLDIITNFIQPIVGKYNIQDAYDHMEKSKELTITVFKSPGNRYALSPHGFSELLQADEKASFYVPLFLILLIVLSVLIPLLLVWLTKKFWYALLVLLVFPILLFAISIIYILL